MVVDDRVAGDLIEPAAKRPVLVTWQRGEGPGEDLAGQVLRQRVVAVHAGADEALDRAGVALVEQPEDLRIAFRQDNKLFVGHVRIRFVGVACIVADSCPHRPHSPAASRDLDSSCACHQAYRVRRRGTNGIHQS